MSEYYVYSYRRADEPNPFYIGKGKGDRLFFHLEESKQPCYYDPQSYKQNKIRKCWSDGVEILIEKIHEGLSEEEAYSLEAVEISKYGVWREGGCLVNHTKQHGGQSGFKWMTNGKEDKTVYPEDEQNMLSQGFKFGKSGYNPQFGYQTSGTVWANDGSIDKRFKPEEVPNGWVLGRLKAYRGEASKGKICINNGDKELQHDPSSPIPEGFVKGRLPSNMKLNPKATKGMRWCNDGSTSRLFKPESIPAGWALGRLK